MAIICENAIVKIFSDSNNSVDANVLCICALMRMYAQQCTFTLKYTYTHSVCTHIRCISRSRCNALDETEANERKKSEEKNIEEKTVKKYLLVGTYGKMSKNIKATNSNDISSVDRAHTLNFYFFALVFDKKICTHTHGPREVESKQYRLNLRLDPETVIYLKFLDTITCTHLHAHKVRL